jgi:hypothetical protein
LKSAAGQTAPPIYQRWAVASEFLGDTAPYQCSSWSFGVRWGGRPCDLDVRRCAERSRSFRRRALHLDRSCAPATFWPRCRNGRSVRHMVSSGGQVAIGGCWQLRLIHAAFPRRRRLSCRWVCRRRIRLLSWGRCSGSIQRGGIHSGKPSALMRQLQPCSRCYAP